MDCIVSSKRKIKDSRKLVLLTCETCFSNFPNESKRVKNCQRQPKLNPRQKLEAIESSANHSPLSSQEALLSGQTLRFLPWSHKHQSHKHWGQRAVWDSSLWASPAVDIVLDKSLQTSAGRGEKLLRGLASTGRAAGGAAPECWMELFPGSCFGHKPCPHGTPI